MSIWSVVFKVILFPKTVSFNKIFYPSTSQKMLHTSQFGHWNFSLHIFLMYRHVPVHYPFCPLSIFVIYLSIEEVLYILDTLSELTLFNETYSTCFWLFALNQDLGNCVWFIFKLTQPGNPAITCLILCSFLEYGLAWALPLWAPINASCSSHFWPQGTTLCKLNEAGNMLPRKVSKGEQINATSAYFHQMSAVGFFFRWGLWAKVKLSGVVNEGFH